MKHTTPTTSCDYWIFPANNGVVAIQYLLRTNAFLSIIHIVDDKITLADQSDRHLVIGNRTSDRGQLDQIFFRVRVLEFRRNQLTRSPVAHLMCCFFGNQIIV